ncbi:MAG TPA: class I adenylate-forming enzyme family protein [Syntrophales bacterium]|nr:class I adenylate-forming enzyme family protein [Syntrophales bacterium]
MIESIFSRLSDPARPYADGVSTLGDIGRHARGIRDAFARLSDPPDTPVCLCIEDRSLLLAALLASLAGGPRFILPHAYDRRVLEEVREVLPFRRILTDAAPGLPAGVEAVSCETCRPEHGDLAPVRSPDEVFLTLFTGGSTGKPRSWSKTPRNLFGEAFFLARTLGVRTSDRLLATVPPQHIYGLLCSVLLPFTAGARILPGTCLFPREILSALETADVTVLVGVPIHYRALKTDDLKRFSLRLALSSAGAVDAADGAFFRERTGLPVTEIFGSTETGGIALRTDASDAGVCIPFPVVDWKIVSDRLAVRSAFISPDLPRDAEGYFLTSDRVAPAQGGFRLLGRTDGIVKVGGKRVDLEEVRNRLRRLPGVKDAHVLALPLKRGRQVELAALVAGDLDPAELRAAVQTMDEAHARPRRLRIAAEIPTLPNGKIDREKIEELLSDATPG